MIRASLAALLVLLIAAPAEAYVREHVDPSDTTTPCLFWTRRTVPFVLSSRGSAHAGTTAAFTALRSSFAAWTGVSCSDFVYQDDGLTDSTVIGFNHAILNQPFLSSDVTPTNTVVFRSQSCDAIVATDDPCLLAANDDCSSVYDCWPYGDSVIALTTTSYDSETGSIFNGNIELNDFTYYFTTVSPPEAGTCGQGDLPPYPDAGNCVSMDVENTVTHESGHLLGLGHSTDMNATMYPSANVGDTNKRVLGTDDINGICAIYPSGLATVTCNESTTTTKGCSCGTSDLGLGALVALAALLRRRRAA